jgi:hypothetical protein
VKRVRVHIHTLVVRGVPGLSRGALERAVVAELEQALAVPGAVERLATGGHRPALRGASLAVQVSGNAAPVARSIAGALKQDPRR